MPVVAAMIAGTGCGSAHRDARVDTVGAPASITAGDGPAGTSDADDQGSDEAGEGSGGEGSAPVDACKVANDLDAIGECEATAPPDAFEPEVQWVWRGGEESSSVVIPLVSNLTDDNGDGEIDLCDIPDVVVLASGQPLQNPGHLYLLDGASGTLHRRFEEPLASDITPALGDIDGDGVPEIVAMDLDGRAVAFEHDGALKSNSSGHGPQSGRSVTLIAPRTGERPLRGSRADSLRSGLRAAEASRAVVR